MPIDLTDVYPSQKLLVGNLPDMGAAYSQPLVIPAAAMDAAASGPALTHGGNPPTFTSAARTLMWMMDAATYERLYAAAAVPPASWATVNIDLWWMNASSGAGDVIWRCDTVSLSDAETTDQSSPVDVTVTAPAQWIVKRTRLRSGFAVTGGDLLRMSIERRGGEAGDTLANDAGVLAVVMTNAA